MKTRLCQTLLVLLIAVGCALILHRPLQQLKREHQVRGTLHAIQRGLMAYVDKKETYPKMSEARGAGLVEFLLATGYLEERPLNPYTGRAYTGEEEPMDRIVYEAEAPFENFTLRALEWERDETFMLIDSGENPAL